MALDQPFRLRLRCHMKGTTWCDLAIIFLLLLHLISPSPTSTSYQAIHLSVRKCKIEKLELQPAATEDDYALSSEVIASLEESAVGTEHRLVGRVNYNVWPCFESVSSMMIFDKRGIFCETIIKRFVLLRKFRVKIINIF